MRQHNSYSANPEPSLFATLNILEAKGCDFKLDGDCVRGELAFLADYPDDSLKSLMAPWVERHADVIGQVLIMRRFYKAQRQEDLAHAG